MKNFDFMPTSFSPNGTCTVFDSFPHVPLAKPNQIDTTLVSNHTLAPSVFPYHSISPSSNAHKSCLVHFSFSLSFLPSSKDRIDCETLDALVVSSMAGSKNRTNKQTTTTMPALPLYVVIYMEGRKGAPLTVAPPGPVTLVALNFPF